MQATIIETVQEALDAKPGLYVVRSGSEAYFLLMSFIEGGYAEFLGEFYDYEDGRTVTVRITTEPHPSNRHRVTEQSTQRTITIGPEFFITALKDYNDWPLKWWREAVQNAVDAGGHNVALGADKQPDGTMLVSCDDDGRGMDEETIIKKFLVLGAT